MSDSYPDTLDPREHPIRERAHYANRPGWVEVAEPETGPGAPADSPLDPEAGTMAESEPQGHVVVQQNPVGESSATPDQDEAPASATPRRRKSASASEEG